MGKPRKKYTKSRTYVLGDLHGAYLALCEVLNRVQKKMEIRQLEGKFPFQSAAPETLIRVIEMQKAKIDNRVEKVCKDLDIFFSIDIAKTGLSNYWVYTMVVVVVGMAQATFITERKKEANYDSLTSLPNRRLFNDRLAHELTKAKRENYPVTLMFMDLDHFKEVNDTMGHHVGDSLLIVASQRVQKCVRESDTVARLGGDEFTVLLPGIGEAVGDNW